MASSELDNTNLSKKRRIIDQAYSSTIVVVGISAFIVVFSLVATKTIWTKMSYQARVIEQKEQARDQLRKNIDSVDELVENYKKFATEDPNIIGGQLAGNGDRDGDNAKIVLDALPSKYDYPALLTSMEKLVKASGSSVSSLTGTDDEVNQQSESQEGPIDMPVELSAKGNYDTINSLLSLFDRSIRPIHVEKIEFTGTNANLEVKVSAKSFYQPGRTLTLKTKVVK